MSCIIGNCFSNYYCIRSTLAIYTLLSLSLRCCESCRHLRLIGLLFPEAFETHPLIGLTSSSRSLSLSKPKWIPRAFGLLEDGLPRPT